MNAETLQKLSRRTLLTAPILAAPMLFSPARAIEVWLPAPTPPGGISWKTLELTKETTRTVKGVIYSKPVFSPAVKALAGKQIKVAGWMMPLDAKPKQSRFVLLAYPPGCPFHFHAMPNQFLEVIASTPFPLDEEKVHIVSGTLNLTGQDESGIFYRLTNARPN
ncbi:DUF3299 domain-containing protein [Sphingomonas sp. BGYR3]|uniref:DUF3299 domain-containing protein n=1 Tax=Sphingomonas sp. BGYR3 TaxID=2975483 RepID=UPI0021A42039|nr:DUF3299 domain-containing protein [Sphingomonas sp. BGYR3]MDG5487255.1 DUF3299 domain-containing protein [Sphingomonas sp. BGYR3]